MHDLLELTSKRGLETFVFLNVVETRRDLDREMVVARVQLRVTAHNAVFTELTGQTQLTTIVGADMFVILNAASQLK